MIWTLLSIVLLLAIGVVVFINQPVFGKLPDGERLARIEKSPNCRNGKFQNRVPTIMITSGKPRIRSYWDFLFIRIKDLVPEKALPSVKTDLKSLNPQDDILVWLGHSSLYLQNSGKRILVDPVLVAASPVSFVNKPFKGTDNYRPAEMPDIDYIIITHDHFDHLDYKTMRYLKNGNSRVICPLGVGAHFERWGFDTARIVELDWNDSIRLDEKIKITSLPARHFSGRGLSSDKSLWASYMLQSSFGNIYLSGDTGYDIHFGEIKKQFGTIDLAIMENGQYNKDWKYIHIMPDELVTAIKELEPQRVMTVHNSKYALGKHAWYEPLENISKASERSSFNLITPMIGEQVNLNDSLQAFTRWWEPVK